MRLWWKRLVRFFYYSEIDQILCSIFYFAIYYVCKQWTKARTTHVRAQQHGTQFHDNQ